MRKETFVNLFDLALGAASGGLLILAKTQEKANPQLSTELALGSGGVFIFLLVILAAKGEFSE